MEFGATLIEKKWKQTIIDSNISANSFHMQDETQEETM